LKKLTDFDKKLTEYIDDLSAEKATVRIDAAIALGEWGDDRGVTPLLKALKHSDDDLRREAARALKEIGNKRAMKPLIKLLQNDPSAEVRAEAAFALAYLPNSYDAVDEIVAALEDRHFLVRQNVCFALGKIQRRKAVKYLIDALKEDENYNVREMAAWALGEMYDKRSIEPLIAALKDEHLAVRKNAALSLGKLEISEAKNQLTEYLYYRGMAKEVSWSLLKLITKRKALRLFKDAYKKMKRIDCLEDSYDLARAIADINPSEGLKRLKELLSEAKLAHYHQEMKELIKQYEKD
jgi:HEAT repeat protein